MASEGRVRRIAAVHLLRQIRSLQKQMRVPASPLSRSTKDCRTGPAPPLVTDGVGHTIISSYLEHLCLGSCTLVQIKIAHIPQALAAIGDRLRSPAHEMKGSHTASHKTQLIEQ
jgi:hypothetical protein